MVPSANPLGGSFCLSQFHPNISVIVIDQCKEQNNMLVKGENGIIRLTENQ